MGANDKIFMKTLSAKAFLWPSLFLYLLMSFQGGLYAQDPEPRSNPSSSPGLSARPNIATLPQVFTPEAAGLGEYGKVPVIQ